MFSPIYQDIKYKSRGSFGSVCSAFDSENNQPVAIKQIQLIYHRQDEYKRIYREMDILKHLNSRYLVRLINVFKTVQDDNLIKIQFVMPLMDFDLKDVMRRYCLRYAQIIKIIYQILMGLQYLYDAGIVHRDLKPSNIGLNGNMDLRLLDFGLARDINGDMTEYVVTRWYRPIEVFCGSDYTTAVDMWSTGCIYAELFLNEVLFQGENQIDQVTRIIKITGFPSPEMLSLTQNENILIGLRMYEHFASKTNRLEEHIRHVIEDFICDEDGGDQQCSNLVIQLICQMLELDPTKRPKPQEALTSELFQRHHSQVTCYPEDTKPEIYSFPQQLNNASEDVLQRKLIERIDNIVECS